MFYSHEILTSRQYGVATIWLVATIGSKSGAKRVTRKAIQEVDVERACEKILDPGAPIALRLQGNLLYGVSNVYNQQCGYMLTDAQKIHLQMQTYVRHIATNQLDPEAGRARLENLVIEDDPSFISANISIPDFVFDNEAPRDLSQNTNKTSSQLSPQQSILSGASSSQNSRFSVQLDVHNSDLSDLHGLQGLSSAHKPIGLGGDANIFDPEEAAGPIDYGISVDEFGNLIETAEPAILGEEPELPPLPTVENGGANAPPADHRPQVDEEGDFIMEEQPLPDAEALPARQEREEDQPDPLASDDPGSQPAPARRTRKRYFIASDEEIEVSRNILKNWHDNYDESCCVPKPPTVTVTQARRNAMLLTFGLGIANIGQNLGVPRMVHPLAVTFSGDALFTAYTGLGILHRSGRKRSATESIQDDDEEERRTRRRVSQEGEQEEQGRGQGVEGVADEVIFDQVQSNQPEVGREAHTVMSDNLSLPWNRGSSLMPGSSARRLGSAQQLGRDLSSPMGKPGSVLDIQRYSDDMPGGDNLDFGSGGGGGLHSADSSFDGLAPPEELVPNQTDSQYTREVLDREGANFLVFMENTIREDGEQRHDDDFERQRKWIAFDDVFVPARTNRLTAAQAFYHCLTLATRGKVIVEQEGGLNEPFGPIYVGIKTAT